MIDPTTRNLMADVDACEQRVEHQLRRDADHVLALAMFEADLRRARQRLGAWQQSRQTVSAMQSRAMDCV